MPQKIKNLNGKNYGKNWRITKYEEWWGCDGWRGYLGTKKYVLSEHIRVVGQYWRKAIRWLWIINIDIKKQSNQSRIRVDAV